MSIDDKIILNQLEMEIIYYNFQIETEQNNLAKKQNESDKITNNISNLDHEIATKDYQNRVIMYNYYQTLQHYNLQNQNKFNTTEPVIEIIEPIINTTDPVIETKPIIETTNPIIETTEPIINTIEPVIDTNPIIDTTDPIVDTTNPIIETTDSVIEIKPIIDTINSVVETNPIIETTNSVVETSESDNTNEIIPIIINTDNNTCHLCTTPLFCFYYQHEKCKHKNVKTCSQGIHKFLDKKDCKFYFCYGKCDRGNTCKFKHDDIVNDLLPKLCMNFVFSSKYNTNCNKNTCHLRHEFTKEELEKLKDPTMCSNKFYHGECNSAKCIAQSHRFKPAKFDISLV